MKEINVNGLGDLPDAAEEILAMLDRRNVVAFFGPMGAGKTTLIREICAQLGSTDTVTSPTFALINRYDAADGSPTQVLLPYDRGGREGWSKLRSAASPSRVP